MKAGRVLDELVAERVMGHIVDHQLRHPNAHAGDLVIWERVPGVPGDPGQLSPYSTEIAAAWLVVGHLHRLGWAVSVHWPWPPATDQQKEEPWVEVLKEPVFDNVGRSMAVGESIPHAICLAALKAVGAEVLVR